MIEQTAPETTPETPKSSSPPIESRFMFVDVAALRAKQLRRGALPRVAADHHHEPAAVHNLERVAMEEVRRGLIEYSIPEFKRAGAGPQPEV
jgi:DNA-directed RNA polymerase subunit K/omega